jgi:hypothetical protein
MKKKHFSLKYILAMTALLLPSFVTSQTNDNVVDSSFFEISMHGGYSSVGTVGLILTKEGLFHRISGSPFTGMESYGFVSMKDLDVRKVNKLMEYIQLNRINEVKGFQYPKEWVTTFTESRPLVIMLHQLHDTSLCHFTYQYKHPLIEEMIGLILDILPKEVALDSQWFNMPERGLVILSDTCDSSAIKSLTPILIFDDTICDRKNMEKTGKNKLLSLGDFVSIRITATLPNDGQQTLLLTLAGFLYEKTSANGSKQFGFVSYTDEIEEIWNVLTLANGKHFLGLNEIRENKRTKQSSNNIIVEMFHHNTLTYKSFCFNNGDKAHAALLQGMNNLIPKKDRDSYAIKPS